jgi:hypothetical protein
MLLCCPCTGHLAVVKLLLAEGADIEQRNVVRADTLLIIAAEL